MSRQKSTIFVLILGFLTGIAIWTVGSQSAWAEQQPVAVNSSEELIALSDQQLSEVAAGDFAMALEDFNITVQGNEAGFFTMDIAQNAFNQAQGVFTTLQTVNSVVDLTVVVNIFLDGPSL